jgi:hypothetical protein
MTFWKGTIFNIDARDTWLGTPDSDFSSAQMGEEKEFEKNYFEWFDFSKKLYQYQQRPPFSE